MRSPIINIVHGDARSTGLPDKHYHCCVTSPPYYGLREYGPDEREIGDEKTPDEYIEAMVDVGREVRRALRDDGVFWLNLGDTYVSAGSGPQGDSAVARQGNRTAAHDVQRRAKHCNGIVPFKNLLGIPWRVALALQADGWILRAAIPWIKASCMPESVQDRPTVAHEYVFLLVKQARYFWDAEAVRLPLSLVSLEQRAYYERNGVREGRTKLAPERGDGDAAVGGTGRGARGSGINPSGRNVRTSDFLHAGLDTIEEFAAHVACVREQGGMMLSPEGDPMAFLVNPKASRLAHFAMWPPRLVAPMIKAATSEAGCCSACGAAWIREVDVGESSWKRRKAAGIKGGTTWAGRQTQSGAQWKQGKSLTDPIDRNTGGFGRPASRQSIGFRQSCSCPLADPVPCRVLDPFGGSGTTAQVARALGRDCDLVELMEKNVSEIIPARLREHLRPEDMSPIKVPDVDDRQGSLF